jgi:hypothetical protein
MIIIGETHLRYEEAHELHGALPGGGEDPVE